MNGSTIIPSARYKDAHAAIAWLCRVFGFEKRAVYDGPENTVAHAELTLGGGMFMLGSVTDRDIVTKTSVALEETGGRETLGLYLVVKDVDAVYARANEAGAEIVRELMNPEHGGRDFACRDLEGHIWWIGSYNPWETQG